jgi:lipoprotein NlpD
MISRPLYSLGLLLCLMSCAREMPPSDVVQVRPPSPYHTVQPGETLASIASDHNMTEQELIDINDLDDSYEVMVGQRLLVNPRKKNIFKKAGAAQKTELVEKDVLPIAPPISSDSASGYLPSDQDTLTALPSHVDEEELVSSASSSKPTPSSSRWPVEGKIIETFTKSKPGVGISAPKGTPVKSIDEGLVKKVIDIKGYGQSIMIKQFDRRIVLYGHLDKALVKEGELVVKGKIIGKVGTSGGAPQPMLHLQIRDAAKKPLDPLLILEKKL